MPGQKIVPISHSASDSVASWDLLKEQQVSTGLGYGVADYMVSSEDHTLDASTGIALQVKTRPLIKARQNRETLNAPSVQKIFEIERGYINMFAAEGTVDETALKLLNECTQHWSAGEIQLPRDEQVHTATIMSLLDRGIYDTIEAIRDKYQLATEDEAIKKYEQLKTRAAEYPPLKEEDKPVSRMSLRRQQNNGD